MLKRWLRGAAIIATAPAWVPVYMVLALPIVIAQIVREEWKQSEWERKRRRLRGERER